MDDAPRKERGLAHLDGGLLLAFTNPPAAVNRNEEFDRSQSVRPNLTACFDAKGADVSFAMPKGYGRRICTLASSHVT